MRIHIDFTNEKTYAVKRWESRILARSSKSTTQQKWNAILDDERRQTSAEIAEQEELREREREEMGDEWASKRFEMFEYGDPEGYMACFKRQDLKVIVKVVLTRDCAAETSDDLLCAAFQASNYILRPGQEYQSDWQLDGMVCLPSLNLKDNLTMSVRIASRSNRSLLGVLLRRGNRRRKWWWLVFQTVQRPKERLSSCA